MRLHFGAGTIITLTVAMMIGGYALYQQQRTNAQPPVVERQLRGVTAGGIAPAPEFLLRHRRELQLAANQVRQIEHLAAAFRADIAPVQQKMSTAAAAYRKFMERDRHGIRPEQQEIDGRAADIERWSGVMATTRQAYWQRARSILTDTQRDRLASLLPKATLDDLR